VWPSRVARDPRSNLSPWGHDANLTEAQKLLLQKFPHLADDDPLIELAAWNAALEEKVDDFGSRLDVWTDAILSQTELSRQQNQLVVSLGLSLEQTSKSNAAPGTTLLQLKTEFGQLQQEFAALRSTISTHGTALQRLSASVEHMQQHLHLVLGNQVRQLEQALATIQEKLDSSPESLTQRLRAMEIKITALTEKFNSELWVSRTAFGVLVVLFLGQYWELGFWGRALQSQLDYVNRNINSALIRLQRLEER